jgi:hypothetical protein
MARSTRLYEQRRNAYQDLAVYLERARLGLERHSVGRHWPKPPTVETVDEWIELMARASISGSATVQAKLAAYHEAEREFYSDMLQGAEGQRGHVLELIDKAEQAMRDELATL